MNEMMQGYFTDIAVFCTRTVEDTNSLGEPTYSQEEEQVPCRIVENAVQSWKDSGLEQAVQAVILCQYDGDFEPGMTVEVAGKTYRRLSAKPVKGLFGLECLRIELSEEVAA